MCGWMAAISPDSAFCFFQMEISRSDNLPESKLTCDGSRDKWSGWSDGRGTYRRAEALPSLHFTAEALRGSHTQPGVISHGP